MKNKREEILKKFQIPEEVFKAIEIFNLIEKKDKILISYSGGPDSTFLTCVMIKLKEIFNLEISLFYLFHKLKGSLPPEKAIEFANKMGLKIFVFEEDIKEFAKKNKYNIEEAGRKKRYELIEKIAREKNFNKIATAHTLEDAFETFFLRFIREGLSLMNPPLRPRIKNIIRPLILIEKYKIIKSIKKLDIPFHLDIENFSFERTRNKIRHIIYPYLEKNFGFTMNNFRKFYLRTIEESLFLQSQIDKTIKELNPEQKKHYIKVEKEKLNSLNSFEKREILKTLLFKLGFEEEITKNVLDKIEELINTEGKIELKGMFSFLSKKDYVCFLKEIPKFEIPLKKGEYEIKNWGKIKVKLEKGKGFLPGYILNKAKIRFRKKGDLIYTKDERRIKLKKFFENKKVPFYLRDRLILVEYNGKIIWTQGFEPFLKGKDITIEIKDENDN